MKLWVETWRLWRYHPRERLKLVLGWFFYRRATQQWLSYLRAHELLWPQVARFPKLVTRIYRPYALRGLGCLERVQLMVDHHDCLRRRGLLALLERSADLPIDMLQLPTKNGAGAALRLVSLRDGHREGEMHLQLHWAGHWLFSLSFLLRPRDDGLDLLITRLQGSRTTDAREHIRAATKDFHGLRPSVVLVHAARQFAATVGCERVLLVSHQQRVALNPMRRWKIQSDLETLWREMGASTHTEGFFVLSPSVPIPQDFSDVASNKRAEARRRAQVLKQMLTDMDQAILANRT